ncbi:hypothetical protein Sme01_05040 [Sphaerisporangium melleum]|uniref:Secreted protein n=1 Tax=Sphaerisporangium melleum TaxID=321316 RepID=A0A917QQE7_9ACTN|nr:hypothetical protein [Sphaerisporangium melleum]GGK62933.1 hypothetical protein GCM10007964_02610 [Sphaerisporangium melleum]GII68028.1 hypothetical protein Sme01_05040 [Sphaerisporangium melleum]
MSIVRGIRNSAVATLIGAASLVALATQRADAAVDPASCVYGYNLSIPQISATCTNPTPTGWYLRVECETPRGTIVRVNGTLVYGPGRGTSLARCPSNTELGQSFLINV